MPVVANVTVVLPQGCGVGSVLLLPLTTTKSVGFIVESLRGNQPSAFRTVWAYVVSDDTVQHPLLMGRDSLARFSSRSYRTLPRATPSDLLSVELTLRHFDDACASAFMLHPHGPPGNSGFRLVYVMHETM